MIAGRRLRTAAATGTLLLASTLGLGEIIVRVFDIDFMHPTALGNRVAAIAVLLDIAAAELLPPGSARADIQAAGDPIDAAIASSLAARR